MCAIAFIHSPRHAGMCVCTFMCGCKTMLATMHTGGERIFRYWSWPFNQDWNRISSLLCVVDWLVCYFLEILPSPPPISYRHSGIWSTWATAHSFYIDTNVNHQAYTMDTFFPCVFPHPSFFILQLFVIISVTTPILLMVGGKKNI